MESKWTNTQNNNFKSLSRFMYEFVPLNYFEKILSGGNTFVVALTCTIPRYEGGKINWTNAKKF